MRDLIVALIVIGSLPICYRRPFIGLLMFTLLAYMRLQDLTWGWARYERWSYYVALATLAGFVLGRGERKFMLRDLRCWIMVSLMALIALSLLMSRFLSKADFENFVEYAKILGVALFTTGVVRNRNYLRILVWVIALSFGFYGVKNGLAFLLSGGSLIIINGPGGMLSDNNDFALALCMGVPLLVHLGLAERRPLIRRATLGIVPLMVMTIVATHSRGAFLALATAAMVLVWRSQNRIAGFALLGIAGVAGFMALPASYTARLSTIGSYEQDSSAQGRLEAWKVAGHMIASNPMLGVGYAKFQQNYKDYDPNTSTEATGELEATGTRVAHNSYLQIWAECGTPAFSLYLALIVLSFLDLWRVRRLAEKRYYTSWIISYAIMFEASLATFVVGSFFLNRAQFDLFYHFVAIITVFGVLAREAMEDELLHPTRSTGERGALALEHGRGFEGVPRRDGFVGKARLGGFEGASPLSQS